MGSRGASPNFRPVTNFYPNKNAIRALARDIGDEYMKARVIASRTILCVRGKDRVDPANHYACLPAQRSNPLSSPPDSSPPTAYIRECLPQASETPEVDLNDIPRSPSSTLWTAPSPSQALRPSSPGLPLLPTLPSAFGIPPEDFPSSPPDHQRTESSLYYTASWGSPYQRPPQGLISGPSSEHRHHRTLSSDDISEDSPARRLNFEKLQPSGALRLDDSAPTPLSGSRSASYSAQTLPRSFAAAVSQTVGKRSIRGFTEDWIQQYLSGQHSTERGNWWSDDSADGETGSTTRELLSGPAEDDGDAWLDFGGDDLGGEPETPTLRTFLKQRQASRSRGGASREKSFRRHKSQKSNETLKQTDFWEFLHDTKEKEKTSDNMVLGGASMWADEPSPPPAKEPKLVKQSGSVQAMAKTASTITEKPLPPAPTDEAGPNSIEQDSIPPITRKRTISPNPSNQRARIAVKWNTRTVVISIPLDAQRGKAGGPPLPLTAREVEERLRKWEQDGFNVTGFSLVGSSEEGVGQSRHIYPDPDKIKAEWQKSQTIVNIPDRREWEAYVNFLKEEKLRKLGVTLGDSEPTSANMSPAPSMGRMGTPHDSLVKPSPSQYPVLPFSPPVPTSSVGSNNTGHPNPFSPPFMPTSTTPSSQVASVASPVSMHAGIHGGFHMPRQSISFMGGEAISGSPFQSMSPIPGIWPTQHLLNQQAMARGGSPAILANLQSMGVAFSPSPVYSQDGNQQFPPGDMTQYNQLRHQQQQLQNHLMHQQQQLNARQSPRLHNVWEAEDESEEVEEDKPTLNSVNPDIVTPVPLGHRQNVSLSLQKDIDDAENFLEGQYHLEKQIQRQLLDDEKAEKSSVDIVKAELNNEIPTNPNSPFGITEPAHGFEYPQQPNGKKVDSDAHSSAEPQADLKEDDLDHPTSSKPEDKLTDPLANSRWAHEEGDNHDQARILHHPQPHNRGHSLSQRQYNETAGSAAAMALLDTSTSEVRDDFSEGAKTNLSDEIETNPSVPGTPAPRLYNGEDSHARSLSNSSNPWHDNKVASPNVVVARSTSYPPKHGSKSSISKFNVEAPEFKMNPKSTFSPGNFSFAGNAFQLSPPAFSPPQNPNVNHASRGSFGTRSAFNVDAATFRPGMLKSAFPTGAFNFSASAPKFRPDVPEFTPRGFVPTISANDLVSSGQSGLEDLPASKGKIFTIPSIPDIIKPAKVSKAIPILPPEDSRKQQSDQEEYQDDDTGRIKQPEGRIKRSRHAGNDGDDVPLFAVPSPLSSAGQRLNVEKDAENNPTPPQVDKENKVPSDEERDVIAHKLAVQPPVTSTHKSVLNQSPDYDGRTWAPYEFCREEEVGQFAMAHPPSPPHKKSFSFAVYSGDSDEAMNDLSVQQAELAASGSLDTAADEGDSVTSIETQAQKHSKKSSLSAAAKPFEFRPNTGSFGVGFGTPTVQEPAVQTFGGHDEPQLTPSSSPPPLQDMDAAMTLRPSQAGSFRTDLIEPRKGTPYPDEQEVDYNAIPIEEVNDIMTYMMEEDPNMGVERAGSPWKRDMPKRGPIPSFESPETPYQLHPDKNLRSDAPSPSPRRFDQRFQAYPSDARHLESPWQAEKGDQDHLGSDLPGVAYDSPVHRLNTPGDLPVSDWDNLVSDTEEPKLQPRSRFFDSHVNELVGSVIKTRLTPLERALGDIQDTLATMSTRRSTSRRDRRSVSMEYANSDADDEDEDGTGVFQPRSRSPKKDRKLEMIKSVVLEALGTQPVGQAVTSPAELSEIQAALAEIKRSLGSRDFEESKMDAIQTIVEESIARQMLAAEEAEETRMEAMRELIEGSISKMMPAPTETSRAGTPGPNTPELQLRIAALESMLRKADARAEEELKARRADQDSLAEARRLLRLAEEDAARHQQQADEELKLRRVEQNALAEAQRLLRLAEEDAAKQRQLAEERGQKLRSFDDKRHSTLVQTQMRTALLEGAQENLQKTASDLAAKNAMLEGNLREARLSGDKWRAEVEVAHGESAELRRTITTLKTQMEESMRVREGMRGKFNSLQEDMATAARDIAKEQALWSKRDMEHKARQEVLGARLEAEGRTRERLEREIERLEVQEREAMRLRVQIEQVRTERGKIEEIVNTLRLENIEYQKTAAKFERESVEARESGRAEIHRAKMFMETQIEAANNQVNVVRAELEGELARLRADLDHLKLDADTAKAKSDLLLEEASDAKRDALCEAAEAKDAALQEQHRKYELHLDEMKSQHERALRNAVEDKTRAETHLLERLSLSDAKNEHLQDRVAHLEEKLEIAKSAAHAAAQAAQSAKASAASPPPTAPISISRSRDLPERISPQALRESILVLQEQLQERESTIEKLEDQLSKLDTDAPARVKERDTEIGWLRELLEVRISDLGDIVDALSQPSYDRNAVKDAAIRLKASLQMEQQERERAMTGGQSFPSLASISSFASPKSVLPLAAAWGNWRNRGRDTSFGNLSEIATGSNHSQTPSKSSPGAQSFLSGLLTPPSTNQRQPSPSNDGSSHAHPNLKDLISDARIARPIASSRQADSRRQAPTTPPLLRKGSYDQDAESGNFSTTGFYDDDDSTVDGNLLDHRRDEPFGPTIISRNR